jgi:hypothetical protein
VEQKERICCHVFAGSRPAAAWVRYQATTCVCNSINMTFTPSHVYAQHSKWAYHPLHSRTCSGNWIQAQMEEWTSATALQQGVPVPGTCEMYVITCSGTLPGQGHNIRGDSSSACHKLHCLVACLCSLMLCILEATSCFARLHASDKAWYS